MHFVPTLSRATGITTGLARLASVAYDHRSSGDSLVLPILQLLAESLEIGQVHVTRVEGETLQYVRVFDRAGMNLHEGETVLLAESYCQHMLEDAAPSLIVEDSHADDRFAALPCTSIAGIGSYTGVPLYHGDGRLYGTLCTLHREARVVDPEEPALLGLAGRIIMQAIDAEEARERERARDAERLVASEERYRTLVESCPDAVLVTDPGGTVLAANQQARETFGFTQVEDLLGINVLTHVAPADQQRAAAAFQARRTLAAPGGRHAEYTLCRRDGSSFPAEVGSSVLRKDGANPTGITVVVRDITDRKRYEEDLKHQALHDTLTDLPNRVLLRDRLEHAILSAQREHVAVSLLLMDLDRFKEVNDTFGHHFGDQLLQELGSRVRGVVRESDTVARLGGDEFAVLLPSADAVDGAMIAEKIHGALEEPFLLEDQPFDVAGSIGIASYPDHGEDVDTLLRHADVAMYLAKHHGTGSAVYTAEQDQYSPARLLLIADVRKAIESDQLLLHYQPKIDLTTGQVVGVEALVRWQHPQHGFIPPDQFIPLTEHTGLIKPLSLWVLEHALHQCRLWHDEGLTIHVAVNLSARNLTDAHLSATVAELLTMSGVQPDWLKVELTESAIMTDLFHSLHTLSRLHEMGVRISVDDFGTGHSSLSYLKRLPISEIKIDRSFVKDMKIDANDQRIVRATITLGHDLGLQAVAEGVEDHDVCRLLTELGCDLAQGYYVSRPLPADLCTDWLRAHQRIHSPHTWVAARGAQ